MQIRADEQDEDDKQKIALMGQKTYTQGGGASGQPNNPVMANNISISTAPGYQDQGKSMIGDPLQPHADSLYHSLTTDRSPATNPVGGQTRREGSHSPKHHNFPEAVGTAKLGQSVHMQIKLQDDGADLTPRTKQLKELGPRDKPVLSLDPVCLSHTKMQPDIIKQFKIACLAYQPSPVVFRNIEFSRSQLIIFRKFLLGQSSKIVHLKEPFRSFKMSTKRIFDDMYLFLKEANLNYMSSIAESAG